MTILFVGESNPDWKNLAEQLEREDHILIYVKNCPEGKKRLETDYSIDLVIINADSSEECGLNLLKSVQNHRTLKQIPIIMAGQSFTNQNVLDYHQLNVFDIILLPIVEASLQAKLSKAELDGRKHILVVDDEEVITDILSKFLEIERFKAEIAHNGEDALQILKQMHIHAVITDIMMPGMNGFDLLVEIKENYPKIPVIMITGHSGSYEPKKVIEAGADGYFAKPFKNTELMFTLQNVLMQYYPASRATFQNRTPQKLPVVNS